MASKVQSFSQDPENICPGTELLSKCSEMLFLIFFLCSFLFSFFFFSVTQQERSRRRMEAGEEKVMQANDLAQVCAEDLSMQLSISTAGSCLNISFH